MKYLIFAAMLFLTALASCESQEDQVIIPSDEEKSQIVEIGDQAAAILLNKLQKELQAAINTGGVAGAITVCNQRAIQITDSLAASLSRVTEIKRTSSRFRNLRNKPDAYDQEALDYYSAHPDRMDTYVQKIKSDGETYFRYYKPLSVKPLCTLCHGEKNNLSPELLSRLNELYPSDLATGYKAGDFRGIVRVTIE